MTASPDDEYTTLANFEPLTYTPGEWVTLLHKSMPRPMAGDAAGTDGNTFAYPAEDPAQTDYLIMSVGVLGAASAGFCLILLLFMWMFHCCMCCSCCQKRCYCAKCCCCNSKYVYFLFMTLGLAGLAPGWLGRAAAQETLTAFKDAVDEMSAIITAAETGLATYATQMGDLKLIVDAQTQGNGNTDCPGKTDILRMLTEIEDGLAEAKLPADAKTLEPLQDMLLPYETSTLMEEIPEFGKGFLTFSLDALFVVIAIWTACLCFFACCAKCNFKMSKSGLCACLHTIYKALVMVFSSLILILNFGLGGVLLVLSTMMSDMCYSDPAANFEIVVDEAGVEFPDGAPDPFWWAKCEGTNPMQTVLDGFKTPLTALVDQIYTPCAAGASPCTVAGQCDTDALKPFLDPALVADNAYTAKMQKTVFDFTELFMCEKLNKVVAGIMYDGVCEGLINTFFFLWAALTASSFFIILAFYLLACKKPSDDDEEDEDDTKK